MCFSDDKGEPINLGNEKMQNIEIKFNKKDKITFDPKKNKWNPYQMESSSVNPEVYKSKNAHNKEDIEQLQKEISEKEIKIQDLSAKIGGVQKKIDTLKNILKIDVEEQLYLQDLLKEKQNMENDNL